MPTLILSISSGTVFTVSDNVPVGVSSGWLTRLWESDNGSFYVHGRAGILSTSRDGGATWNNITPTSGSADAITSVSQVEIISGITNTFIFMPKNTTGYHQLVPETPSGWNATQTLLGTSSGFKSSDSIEDPIYTAGILLGNADPNNSIRVQRTTSGSTPWVESDAGISPQTGSGTQVTDMDMPG